MRAVTRFRIRLVEQLIEGGSGDFTVEADTPEQAATLLLRAHDAAREDCRDLVTLPDGQAQHIEPRDVIGNRVFCIRLDNAGNEIGGEINPDFGPSLAGRDGQNGASPSGVEPHP